MIIADIKRPLSIVKQLIYARCFVTCMVLFILFTMIYLFPLNLRHYNISLFGLKTISSQLSIALSNRTYVRLLLVVLFMSIPPTLQLLIDSWKFFSKNKQDRIELTGSWLLLLSLILPNLISYLVLNDENTDVTDRIRYLWVALSRIKSVGILLGVFSQLFCQDLKYTDKNAVLPFNLEKRMVNISFIFPISALFSVLSMINPKYFRAEIAAVLNLIVGLLVVYVLVRILINLCFQLTVERQFRSHHHLSDFMYSFGLFTFLAITVAFEILAVRSSFSIETLSRYIVSALCTEIVLMVLITIIPGVKNRRLAEIKHEQLEARLNLIRYVSHEMRTPLNTISMGMKMLNKLIEKASNLQLEKALRQLLPKETSVNRSVYTEMTKIANQITESCDVAVSTLDDLLTFDKLDEQKLVIEVEEVNPWKLLLDTAKPFSINASLKEIKFQVTLLEPNADFLKTECIQADPFKLAQVIRNLLSNAIKFTPEKGTVNVTMKIEESGEGGRTVRFSVKDDGAGISAENMKKLFGQYVQFNAAQLQKGKGSGLGLWITKSIVELHGGRIGAKSEGEGQGTEFYVDIPLRPLSKASLLRDHSPPFRAFLRSASAVPKSSRLYDRTFDSPVIQQAKPDFFSWLEQSWKFDVFVSYPKKRNKVHTVSTNPNIDGSFPQAHFGSFLNYPVRLMSFDSVSNIEIDARGGVEEYYDASTMVDIETGESNCKTDEEECETENSFTKRIRYAKGFDGRGRVTRTSLNTFSSRQTFVPSNTVIEIREWKDGLNILLVDDAVVNRRICKRVLASEGHTVKDAVDGLDCLRVYEEAISLGNSFDLILLDDNMPNLLGYETAKRLRGQGYEGIIIGVTGDIYEENIQRFIENGANDVMPKPLNMEKLEEKFNLLKN